jgi:hypothetical protein
MSKHAQTNPPLKIESLGSWNLCYDVVPGAQVEDVQRALDHNPEPSLMYLCELHEKTSAELGMGFRPMHKHPKTGDWVGHGFLLNSSQGVPDVAETSVVVAGTHLTNPGDLLHQRAVLKEPQVLADILTGYADTDTPECTKDVVLMSDTNRGKLHVYDRPWGHPDLNARFKEHAKASIVLARFFDAYPHMHLKHLTKALGKSGLELLAPETVMSTYRPHDGDNGWLEKIAKKYNAGLHLDHVFASTGIARLLKVDIITDTGHSDHNRLTIRPASG